MSVADSLLKQMDMLSWFQRAELLDKIARDYGEGFARVVREELERWDRKKSK